MDLPLLFSAIFVFVCLCLSPCICHCICLFYLYHGFHNIFPKFSMASRHSPNIPCSGVKMHPRYIYYLNSETRSSKDECSTGSNNHLRFTDLLDHILLSSIDQKILITLPPLTSISPPFSFLVGHWRSSGCLLSPIHHHILSYYLSVFLSFCLLFGHLSSYVYVHLFGPLS